MIVVADRETKHAVELLRGLVDDRPARRVPGAKPVVGTIEIAVLIAGVFVLLGWHRFIGAGVIAIFLVLTAPLVHPFWKEDVPAARMSAMSHFMKDLALAGAALLIAFYSGGDWPASFG